ncbi:MAG: thiamine-binding protein [Thermoplasmatota archaeon]
MDRCPSLSRYVKKAIEAVYGTGISYQVTAMGTILEATTLDKMFRAAEAAVEAVKAEASRRISLSLKVYI